MHRSSLLLLFCASCASGAGDQPDAAPAPDATPTPDAAAFTPLSLTGIALWLDANHGVLQKSAKVTSWTDYSGHGNDALPGADAPLFVNGLVNSLPAVRFDGTGTYLQLPDSATLQWGTGDFLVEVVAAYRNPSSLAMLYGKALQTSPFEGCDLFVNFSIPVASTGAGAQMDATHNATGATTGLNDNKFHRFAMRRVGNTLEVHVDGMLDGMADVTGMDADALGAKPTIGGQAKIVQMLSGDIAEVVAVGGTVSDGDLASLESYLQAKYAL